MATERKAAANRRNARRSTGPCTNTGKAVVKLNAVAHGLRALSPVLPGERARDWDEHRAGVAAALAPVGALETELADRVALLTWRLRRVVRYETAASTAEQDGAALRARGEPDPSNPFADLFPARPLLTRSHARVRAELDTVRDTTATFTTTRDQFARLLSAPSDQPLDGREACRFVTELVKVGVAPKDAKELARHRSITLTMDRYAHVGVRDTAAAVAKLSLSTGPARTCGRRRSRWRRSRCRQAEPADRPRARCGTRCGTADWHRRRERFGSSSGR